jgi:hypothetical protein
MTMRLILVSLALLALAGSPPARADAPRFEGTKVCTKCHDLQGAAWEETAHARALDSLKPSLKAEAKTKANLDPAKDYTQDADCLGCHTTGYGRPGGYAPGSAAGTAKPLAAVGCESCHGAGSEFRQLHGDAENRLKRQSERTERAVLVKAGQTFDYQAACAACHQNYHGSPWTGVKPPYTPFTPAVDPKYAFDFDTAVRKAGKGAGVHTHYKLTGVFTGEPEPPLRAEFQKTAREPE